MLFSWRCQWKALQFLNSSVLDGNSWALEVLVCAHLYLDKPWGCKHPSRPLDPFPCNKKWIDNNNKKKNCLDVHIGIALMAWSLIEKNSSSKFLTYAVCPPADKADGGTSSWICSKSEWKTMLEAKKINYEKVQSINVI